MFRSTPMQYIKLAIPKDATHQAISALGDMGCMHFADVRSFSALRKVPRFQFGRDSTCFAANFSVSMQLNQGMELSSVHMASKKRVLECMQWEKRLQYFEKQIKEFNIPLEDFPLPEEDTHSLEEHPDVLADLQVCFGH